MDLNYLRAEAESAKERFDLTIRDRFPGLTEWHWYRALTAVRGGIGRLNEDQSHDMALAHDCDIKAAYNKYIRLLHVFYRARDGERGVLGGRGL